MNYLHWTIVHGTLGTLSLASLIIGAGVNIPTPALLFNAFTLGFETAMTGVNLVVWLKEQTQ